MSDPSRTDPLIVYHNPFENTIFNNPPATNMSSQAGDDEAYQRFTATGRPIPSSSLSKRTALSGGGAASDSIGASAPNLLPVRFTDSSIISVPVLPHTEASQVQPNDNPADGSDDSDEGPVKQPKPRSRLGFSSFGRRKSSATGGGGSKKARPDFVIKQMTRAHYLQHYAKDDDGRYIGSEDPAPDCILNGEDRLKWRRA